MILMQKKQINTVKSVLLTILVLCFTACNSEPSITIQPNEISWKTSTAVAIAVGASEGVSTLVINGELGVDWSAEITNGTGWCSFSNNDYTNSTKEGTIKAGLNVLYIYYARNTGTGPRQAEITFRFKNEAEHTFELNQLTASEESLPSFGTWAEVPAHKANSNYQYVTHYTTLNSKTVRNFSLCFDKTKKAALWVAYPLHSAYLGSSGRTDAWAFDPIISNTYQADCVRGSYGGNYDRGHQLPSADRQATTAMNAQTFYMSNMTPQLDRLNQDMWANLETKVRSYICSDTLYVVTGAYFSGSTSNTTDRSGNIIPLPTNYFKVLLRTKSGSTGKAISQCDDSELVAIGFWVDHKSYGKIQPPRSICTSVADIEAKTGFSFFPQVSAAVRSQNNPAQWGL